MHIQYFVSLCLWHTELSTKTPLASMYLTMICSLLTYAFYFYSVYTLYFFYIFYIILRADYHLHTYLHHFVAARNTRALAALCELDFVIPRWRTDQFSRLFLPAAVGLWNLLPSVVCSGVTFNPFKSAMNLCQRRV